MKVSPVPGSPRAATHFVHWLLLALSPSRPPRYSPWRSRWNHSPWPWSHWTCWCSLRAAWPWRTWPLCSTQRSGGTSEYLTAGTRVPGERSVMYWGVPGFRYAVYPASTAALATGSWCDNTVLLVVCGSVPDMLAPRFLQYLLQGGSLLCLCSDLLYLVLPTFRTAEVRERELVQFSYAKWKRVRMMHHIFCYQASPAHTKFSPRDAR